MNGDVWEQSTCDFSFTFSQYFTGIVMNERGVLLCDAACLAVRSGGILQ